ncbi:MAG: F0F1 ATP synthase subunit alpha [Candidatus Daviesbacteria bacterium]|nr:F0F1 ATP synthase subunit alpha [Candidatus Daviesbacteria bacterium]
MKLTDQSEIGYVYQSQDFLIRLNGLPTVQINDLVENESGGIGWVNTLMEDYVEVLMLNEGQIIPGQLFKKLPYKLGVSAGKFLLGRAINPLGVPIDGRGLLTKTKDVTVVNLEQTAPGIESRQFITKQFETGITIIDSLLPLGKGQRELVLGDAHSGKTSFLVDLIVNQRGKNTVCIYASIGKPIASVRDLIDVLKANQALSYTVVIAASSTEPAPLIFLTPKTALALAEYFQKQGLDVLVILDDLGIHAKVHREISLLGGRAPGRESYPGDIFYQHARLMERAGNFRSEFGGASITAIPVMELNLTDFASFIPTNLMAMTDGHLLFRSNLYNLGQRPAIDLSQSVTRVGRQTQDRISNLISLRIRQILSQAEELQTISRFSAELPPQTQLVLKQKKMIDEILKQASLTFIPKHIQSILLGLVFTSFIKEKDEEYFTKEKSSLIKMISNSPQMQGIVQAQMTSDNQFIQHLEQAIPSIINQPGGNNP